MNSVPRIVLIMSPQAGYDRGMIRGIARYARLNGPWAFLLTGEQFQIVDLDGKHLDLEANSDASHEEKALAKTTVDFKRLGASGIIGRLYSPQITEAVLASKLPMVAMDLSREQISEPRIMSAVSEIRPDSQKAGRMAAEHLLDRGFQHFAFCGFQGEIWSQFRQEGFAARLKEAGFDCPRFPSAEQKSRVPWNREQPVITAWLNSLPKPVGVMACNDVRGRQIIEACALGQMHVPNDVAVVGVDEDRLLSELSNPPLSSVALNAEQGGFRAAELLDDLLAGRANDRQTLLVEPLWVVTRPSTDVLAIEDRDVSAAVAFIRKNAKRPIGVQDVVKQTAMSRRALEIRFQRCLGRSIRGEIERIRLEWTKQLLVETDLPLGKIADCAGFGSQSYLSKVFHETIGVTLTQYRRDHRIAQPTL
jgi:LacI family transcriptional regulator